MGNHQDVVITNRRVAVLLVLALLLLVWGAFGFFERLQYGRGGFTYFDYTINHVNRGGAAEQAGLRVGDRVVSVDGLAVEELPLYSRWPRDLVPRVGESLAMVVERDGEPVALEIVYADTPRSIINMRLVVAAIGLAFMAFCLWPILTVRTPHALALAHVGLVAGLATFGIGPYLGTWDGVASHVQLASMMLLFALLLLFLLRFPRPERLGEKRVTRWLIFGPWVLFVGCLVLELVFHPRLYHTFGGPGMILLMAYGGLALAAVVHSLIKTPRQELWSSGMGWILAGLLVGMAPSVVVLTGTLLIPGLQVPGAVYFPLLIVAIPLSLALAVKRQARSVAVPTRA
jgi:hypothetical protein